MLESIKHDNDASDLERYQGDTDYYAGPRPKDKRWYEQLGGRCIMRRRLAPICYGVNDEEA